MTKGEGLIGLLYALKDMVETFAMMIITGIGLIAFFWLIVQFIAGKMGWSSKGSGWLTGGKKVEPRNIMMAVFLLFVILSIYSLIGLTAAIFGVNSSPSGGILVR